MNDTQEVGMNKCAAATLVAIPVFAVGGIFYGQSSADAIAADGQQVTETGYVCPVAGQTLPCQKCCQLNK